MRSNSVLLPPPPAGPGAGARARVRSRRPPHRSDVIRRSARKEFEEARYETVRERGARRRHPCPHVRAGVWQDPHIVTKMLVVGRDCVMQVEERVRRAAPRRTDARIRVAPRRTLTAHSCAQLAKQYHDMIHRRTPEGR